MCDGHGEESLSGRLAKETLLPPGRPAASPPRAPLAARDWPASLLLPRVSARPNPAAPCCPHLAARPPRRAAPQPPRQRCPVPTAAPRPARLGTPGHSAGLALAPLAPQEPRDVTRGRPSTPGSRGPAVWARDVPRSLPGPVRSPFPGGPRRAAVRDSVSWVFKRW